MTTKNSKQGHIFAFEWVEIESRSEPQLMKKGFTCRGWS